MATILYSFLACVGFCLVFEIKKPSFIFFASLIGAVAWAVYLLMANWFHFSAVISNLIATVAMSVLAELLARILKAPTTIFLVIGIVPLVPGGGLYYTMSHLLDGELELFTQRGLNTIAAAGAIAVGVSLVSSIARMIRKGPAAIK